jgi:hypothetical protein
MSLEFIGDLIRKEATDFGEWLATNGVKLSYGSDVDKASEGLPLSTQVYDTDLEDTWKTMQELYDMWVSELRTKAKEAVENWPE